MNVTKLRLNESLPLTCARTGTCCHGNHVRLNPWELAQLANEKQLSVKEFRDTYCLDGGSLLHFNGKKDHRGKAACGLYTENFGCSVHTARPLACRLFPLGRQVQHETAEYIFEGTTFPCIDGCSEVLDLPKITVADYLAGQETADFELAQDAYLEIMQNLADSAFTLLLDTELAQSGDTKTLRKWRTLGQETAEQFAQQLSEDWLNALMLPALDEHLKTIELFAIAHNEYLQTKTQELVDSLETLEDIHTACISMMTLALFLARALGADPKSLSELWIDIAKANGALE